MKLTGNPEVEIGKRGVSQGDIVDPVNELKVEGGGPEFRKPDGGGRIRKNVGMVAGDCHENVDRSVEKGGVHADPDFQVHACFWVPVAPVDDLVGDQVSIRDDDGDVVPAHDCRRSPLDLDNGSQDSVDFDQVSDLDRLFQEDDHQSDHVCGEVLETYPDTDAQDTQGSSEKGEPEAQVVKADDDRQGENKVGGKGRQESHHVPRLGRGLGLGPGGQCLLEEVAKEESQEDNKEEVDQSCDGDRGFPQVEEDDVPVGTVS